MSEDINKATVLGRLTRDMELSYTSGGFAIGKLSLASNTRKKKGDQWEDHANFFDCKMFGKRAESLAPYLLKGTQVAIEGKLEQERWESQDGSKRSKVVINVDNIQLLSKKGESRAEDVSPSGPRFEDDVPY